MAGTVILLCAHAGRKSCFLNGNLSEKKTGFQEGIPLSVEKFEQMLSADFQSFQEYVDFLLLVFGVAYRIEPAFGRNGVVDAQTANRGGCKGKVHYRAVVAYG